MQRSKRDDQEDAATANQGDRQETESDAYRL
jgi:hypothetical protein